MWHLLKRSHKQISEYQTTADLSKISEKMALLILKQADSYMDELKSALQSISGRATGLVGIYSSGATLSLAAGWSISDQLKNLDSPFLVELMIFAFLWIAAAIFCALILIPRSNPAKGSEPANWLNYPDLVSGNFKDALIGLAERYQDRIPYYIVRIEKDARLLKWAIGLGILGPTVIGLSISCRLIGSLN